MAAAVASDIGADLLARVDVVPELTNRLSVEELSGGLTNRNLKVTTDDGVFVARLSSPDTALLSIDRDVEHANSVVAARSGAGPEVIAYVPEANVLVVRFIDGRTWGDADVLQASNASRLAQVCRLLHAGEPFKNEFNMLHLQQQYLHIVLERGFRLPDRYRDFAEAVTAIAAAFEVSPVGLVPCNNDLLAANFIDSGDRVWLIDYEYSGNNDPFFEIGNIWSEARGTPDDLERLVSAYVGYPSKALTARARLWGLMSKYGWTLWASIQDATSEIDFDFWAWGREKYERAVAEFESPGFGRLLAQVRGGV
jgi:thiamine kinase-like enzyme